MAFETEFVKALSSKRVNIIDERDLYECYYCQKIFAKNESASIKECRYHSLHCMCRNTDTSYGKCCRLPYHSPVELDIAKPPAK
jgi:hypothetical protein